MGGRTMFRDEFTSSRQVRSAIERILKKKGYSVVRTGYLRILDDDAWRGVDFYFSPREKACSINFGRLSRSTYERLMDETDNDVETFVLNEYMYNASVFVEGFSTDDGWPMERYTTPGFPERLNELIVAICELLDQSNEDLLAEYGVFLISI